MTKLCGLFLWRKSKPRRENLTKTKKECSNLVEKLTKSSPRVEFLPFSSNLKYIMRKWYEQDQGPTQQS